MGNIKKYILLFLFLLTLWNGSRKGLRNYKSIHSGLIDHVIMHVNCVSYRSQFFVHSITWIYNFGFIFYTFHKPIYEYISLISSHSLKCNLQFYKKQKNKQLFKNLAYFYLFFLLYLFLFLLTLWNGSEKNLRNNKSLNFGLIDHVIMHVNSYFMYIFCTFHKHICKYISLVLRHSLKYYLQLYFEQF